jgi:NitT/TauT family transport system ATP-binding protein/sulfonate transport system ATP-binding protein
MATGPAIEIAIRDKRFAPDAPPLFADLRLSIAPESVTALVGPSGVGKSSLLRIVAGIDTAFDGEVRVGGTAARDAPPPGFVLQDARLLPWLTAIDNIRAVAPGIEDARALALLDRVGLHGAADAYPHELSGGMQRRVALARAFSVNAELLLLDEPFVSLDRVLVDELQALFVELVEAERPTVVLVTHLVEDAVRLADRAVALRGRPARIVSDIAFDIPRRNRTAEDRAQLAARIAAAPVQVMG